MIFHILPLFALAAILPSSLGQTAAQITTFRNALLAKTNELRARHGSPAVTLGTFPTDTAQEWADHLASMDQMEHSDTDLGENIYVSYSRTMPTGEIPAQDWYSEIADYHWFGGEPDMSTFGDWGHFTALVWKSVEKIDIGIRKSASNGWYVVCRYSPTTNMGNQYAMNVPALLKKSMVL